jgi:transcriptional regulator with XRE-family HTH domain
LTKDFTPERRARIEAKKTEMLQEMSLQDLRKARAMTQRELGDNLKVNQPAVAKIERRADMYVSNLRSYIEAMGGTLTVIAEFSEGPVTITNFSQIGQVKEPGGEQNLRAKFRLTTTRPNTRPRSRVTRFVRKYRQSRRYKHEVRCNRCGGRVGGLHNRHSAVRGPKPFGVAAGGGAGLSRF